MFCVVVLEVEDGDFSDLKGSALNVHSSVIEERLSLLLHSCFGRTRFPALGASYMYLQCIEPDPKEPKVSTLIKQNGCKQPDEQIRGRLIQSRIKLT